MIWREPVSTRTHLSFYAQLCNFFRKNTLVPWEMVVLIALSFIKISISFSYSLDKAIMPFIDNSCWMCPSMSDKCVHWCGGFWYPTKYGKTICKSYKTKANKGLFKKKLDKRPWQSFKSPLNRPLGQCEMLGLSLWGHSNGWRKAIWTVFLSNHWDIARIMPKVTFWDALVRRA